MDRAIGGLLNDEDHEEIRGDYGGTQKDIGASAPICCVRTGEVLSMTQPDIAVIRENLLGWLLVWRLMSPNQIFSSRSRPS